MMMDAPGFILNIQSRPDFQPAQQFREKLVEQYRRNRLDTVVYDLNPAVLREKDETMRTYLTNNTRHQLVLVGAPARAELERARAIDLTLNAIRGMAHDPKYKGVQTNPHEVERLQRSHRQPPHVTFDDIARLEEYRKHAYKLNLWA